MSRTLLCGDDLRGALLVAAERLPGALGLPSAAIELHPVDADDRFMGAPSLRRGLGRLTEPAAIRLVRALPEVDVRLVAQRSASG
ncbi:MAG: hypothetical protein ACRDLN_00845 [Solirubrobacteraceae bacterium]